MRSGTNRATGATREKGFGCSFGRGRALGLCYRLFLVLLPTLALHNVAAQPVSAERSSAPATESIAPLDRELLNSERIEQQFGSYGIEVLHSDDTLRVSDLFSGSGAGRVTRTFAVVFYPTEVEQPFAAEHAEILDGGSIGAVFARNGWSVEKTHRFFGELEASPKVATLMHEREKRPLAVHVYILSVSREGAQFDYATIAEIHHPEYLSLDDLRRIYGDPEFSSPDADPLVGRILDAAAERMR